MLNALTPALTFFTTLREHVNTLFADPAQREDAIKALSSVSDNMTLMINENQSLEMALEAGDEGGKERHVLQLMALAKVLPAKLDAVVKLVPDTEKAEANKAITTLQNLVFQHSQNYYFIYNARPGESDADILKQVKSVAQQTTKVSYDIRQQIQDLVTELAKKNRKQ